MPNMSSSYSHGGFSNKRTIGYDGLVTDTATWINGAIVGTVDRVSVNTPGFGKFKRLGKKMSTNLPLNPFYFKKTETKALVGSYRIFSPSIGYTIIYTGVYNIIHGAALNGGRLLLPDTDQLIQARSNVDAKLLDKLKGMKVNLGQVFAERKMTADLIASSASRIAASMILLKKGRFREATRALGASVSTRKTARFNRLYPQNPRQAVASGWLELQYGWLPLLSDVYGSAEWLAQKQSREIRNKVAALHHLELNDFTRTPLGGGYVCDVLRESNTIFDYKGVVWFATSGAELASLKQAGLTNPILLAWELLPYSFVVDWFLPVGNFLSNLDSTLGLSFDKGSYTLFWTARAKEDMLAFSRTGGTAHGASDEIHDAIVKSSRSEVYNERLRMSSFPENSLPSFKNPFSFTHAANAIALLSPAFSRKS